MPRFTKIENEKKNHEESEPNVIIYLYFLSIYLSDRELTGTSVWQWVHDRYFKSPFEFADRWQFGIAYELFRKQRSLTLVRNAFILPENKLEPKRQRVRENTVFPRTLNHKQEFRRMRLIHAPAVILNVFRVIFSFRPVSYK